MKRFTGIISLALVLSIFAFTASFAQDGALTYLYNGVERSYYYYEPDTMIGQRPLILLLHGYGGSATDYCPKMVQTALDNGFAICVPQGAKDPEGEPSWNVGYPFQQGWEMDDVDFLCELASSLAVEHNLNSNDIFVTGMSNGGEMSYLLAHQKPDFFAAFAPIAGLTMQWMKDSLTINKAVSLMEVHGTSDTVSMWEGDPENTGGWGAYLSVPEAVRRFADKAACKEEKVRELQDSILLHEFINPETDVEVLLYEVKGGVHGWALDRLDTPSEIIAFFKRHLR